MGVRRQESCALPGWNGTNGGSGAGGGRMPGCVGTSGCRMSYLEGAIGRENGQFLTCFRYISRENALILHDLLV